MMGGAGMPDLGNMDLSQMLGGGLKGKVGSFCHETCDEASS